MQLIHKKNCFSSYPYSRVCSDNSQYLGWLLLRTMSFSPVWITSFFIKCCYNGRNKFILKLSIFFNLKFLDTSNGIVICPFFAIEILFTESSWKCDTLYIIWLNNSTIINLNFDIINFRVLINLFYADHKKSMNKIWSGERKYLTSFILLSFSGNRIIAYSIFSRTFSEDFT